MDLPTDLIEAKHAARLAQCHVSAVHRWVYSGKILGWKRAGRLFVSRAAIEGLFVPVEPAPVIDTRAEFRPVEVR